MRTQRRPPEVSLTAVVAHSPNLQSMALMEEDFADPGPLVRPGLPRIRFLSVESRLCSTLLSDDASRRRPCASLALRLHLAGQRTFTSKLSNMLGTHGPMDAQTRPQVLGNRSAIPTAPTSHHLFFSSRTDRRKESRSGQRPANDHYPSAAWVVRDTPFANPSPAEIVVADRQK